MNNCANYGRIREIKLPRHAISPRGKIAQMTLSGQETKGVVTVFQGDTMNI